MDSAFEINASMSHKIILDNPQIEEQKCRICYEETKPLITLCECSGSIAYVHEDCILDWITKKMENSEVVEIPKCEICRTTYSAKLKIGRKKVCPKLLLKKVRELKLEEMASSVLFILGTVFAVIIASTFTFNFLGGLLSSAPTPSPATLNTVTSVSGSTFVTDMIRSLIFPLWFMRCAIDHGKKRLKLLDESRVQIVEVTLNPKIIIKQ